MPNNRDNSKDAEHQNLDDQATQNDILGDILVELLHRLQAASCNLSPEGYHIAPHKDPRKSGGLDEGVLVATGATNDAPEYHIDRSCK